MKNFCEEPPLNACGFVYKITNLQNGKIYIGKKSLYSKRRIKIPKREKLLNPSRKIYKEVIKETDWRSYTGSSLVLNQDIALLGEDLFEKEIIQWAYTRKELSYLEVKWQFHYNVLEIDSYNGNILGRFFRQ